MKFLVLMAEEDTWDRWNAAGQAEQDRMMAQLGEFAAAVEKRGTLLAGEALGRPEGARTLRPGDHDGRRVTEGPFAETVEQLGGFYLVDLDDLDTAVETARLLPDAWTIEVRPIAEILES
jgi:hypothetical protein